MKYVKYALIIVKGPSGDKSSDYTDSLNLLNGIRGKIQQKPGVDVLNQYAYVCHLEHGLYALNAIASEAAERGFESRTLFFENEPSFVVSEP